MSNSINVTLTNNAITKNLIDRLDVDYVLNGKSQNVNGVLYSSGSLSKTVPAGASNIRARVTRMSAGGSYEYLKIQLAAGETRNICINTTYDRNYNYC
jgi:hypothetical protein